MADINVGDKVKLTATFADLDDVATDPTTVSLSFVLPDDTVVTYTYADNEITKVSTGVYSYLFSVTMAGLHRYRWFSTGTIQLAERGSFTALS